MAKTIKQIRSSTPQTPCIYSELREERNLGDGAAAAGELPSRKNKLYYELKYELSKLRHDQITDVYVTFLTRLDRYMRIQSIKYLLNKFYQS